MEPLKWMHSLISLDTMHVRPGPKFCDKEAYNVHPLHTISLVELDEQEIHAPHLLLDEVSVESVSPDTLSSRTEKDEPKGGVCKEDGEVPEEEVEKVRLLLKNREPIDISVKPESKPRRFCKSHQRLRKKTTLRGEKDEPEREVKPIPEPPHLEGKSEYLCYVGAKDSISIEQQWKQGLQMAKPVLDPQPQKAQKKRKVRIKKLGNNPLLVEASKSATKAKRKAYREEQKRIVKTYSSSDDSDEEEVAEYHIDVPSTFKRYTI